MTSALSSRKTHIKSRMEFVELFSHFSLTFSPWLTNKYLNFITRWGGGGRWRNLQQKQLYFFLHHDENSSRFDEILKFLSLSFTFLDKKRPTNFEVKNKIQFNDSETLTASHELSYFPPLFLCARLNSQNCSRQFSISFITNRASTAAALSVTSASSSSFFNFSKMLTLDDVCLPGHDTQHTTGASWVVIESLALLEKSFPHLAASNGTWGALRMRVLERQWTTSFTLFTLHLFFRTFSIYFEFSFFHAFSFQLPFYGTEEIDGSIFDFHREVLYSI